jgi:hypothetical protein
MLFLGQEEEVGNKVDAVSFGAEKARICRPKDVNQTTSDSMNDLLGGQAPTVTFSNLF